MLSHKIKRLGWDRRLIRHNGHSITLAVESNLIAECLGFKLLGFEICLAAVRFVIETTPAHDRSFSSHRDCARETCSSTRFAFGNGKRTLSTRICIRFDFVGRGRFHHVASFPGHLTARLHIWTMPHELWSTNAKPSFLEMDYSWTRRCCAVRRSCKSARQCRHFTR